MVQSIDDDIDNLVNHFHLFKPRFLITHIKCRHSFVITVVSRSLKGEKFKVYRNIFVKKNPVKSRKKILCKKRNETLNRVFNS